MKLVYTFINANDNTNETKPTAPQKRKKDRAKRGRTQRVQTKTSPFPSAYASLRPYTNQPNETKPSSKSKSGSMFLSIISHLPSISCPSPQPRSTNMPPPSFYPSLVLSFGTRPIPQTRPFSLFDVVVVVYPFAYSACAFAAGGTCFAGASAYDF